MLYSYKWLQQFLSKIPPVDDIARKLTLSGLEVEYTRKLYTDIDGIVTARIQGIKPHPNSDKLYLAEVFTGSKTFETITGAQGLSAGMVVAYAPSGARIINNRTIADIDIKSARSSGMIVSEDELGIPGYERSVISFDQSTVPGTDVKSILGLDDWIIDVAVTPNRSDVLSHLGLAREIATLFRLKVVYPSYELNDKKHDNHNAAVKVRIESPHDCPRYTLRLISGVHISASPLWLRILLGKIEQKPVNNIVDITNYVMFGIGQPLHAFDRHTVDGSTIMVRRAHNEKLITLDDQERMLSNQTLVIADEKKPVAIAGLMGGRYSGITDQTKDVLLESAIFAPPVIRRTGRNLGMQTEAGYRFERGIDPGLPKIASGYASYLISQMTGAKVYKLVDNRAARSKKIKIIASMDTLQTIIGFPLNMKRVQSILKSTYCSVKRVHAKTLSVEPPSFRLDLVHTADLAEEIARITGYDKIPSLLPLRQTFNVDMPSEYMYTGLIRNYLLSNGFDEVINYSFYSENDHAVVGDKAVSISNPLNEQTMLMRTSLVPQLIKNAQFNIFRQVENQRIFETGKVYFKTDNRYEEQLHITGLLTGMRYPFQWAYMHENVDLFDAIGIVEGIADLLKLSNGLTVESGTPDFLAQDNTALFKYKGDYIGFAGEVAGHVLKKYDITQQLFVFDVAVEPLLADASAYTSYSGVPRYPHIARDLTIVKPVSLPSQNIISGIRSLGMPLLAEIFPFDLYVDKKNISEHSITYRFIFRAEDRTLKDEEVDRLMKAVMEYITGNYNVKLKV